VNLSALKEFLKKKKFTPAKKEGAEKKIFY
jgi:hypothetical protein